jgi:PPOX class probable F420-dependent enzyme
MNQLASYTTLDGNSYIALTTYRKNGTPVMTPVWFVQRDEKLFVWTAGDSGKAKRLKNNPHVQLVPSNHSGKPLGAVQCGLAHFAEQCEYSTLEKAFKAKYGWLVNFFALIWKIQRHPHTYVEITPSNS